MTFERSSTTCIVLVLHLLAQGQDRRRVGIGDEVELLHGSGHRHIQQTGATFGDVHVGTSRGPRQDLVGIHDDHAVELEALHRLGPEQRDLGGIEFVYVIDSDEAVRRQRCDNRTVERRRERPLR